MSTTVVRVGDTTLALRAAVTARVDLYVAGDPTTAREACREFCMEGLCVTVEPVDYVFTGGAEGGVRVGLRHYPRFPSEEPLVDLVERATRLGELLLRRLHQMSFMVVADDVTTWFSRRPEDLTRK